MPPPPAPLAFGDEDDLLAQLRLLKQKVAVSDDYWCWDVDAWRFICRSVASDPAPAPLLLEGDMAVTRTQTSATVLITSERSSSE